MISEKEANMLLVDYLVHSYIYYELSTSLIPDREFDELAHRLYAARDNVTHEHKSLVNWDLLSSCTSGFYLKYPDIVRSTAVALVEKKMRFIHPLWGRRVS